MGARSTENMTDATLIRLGLVDELCLRMSGKEFVVCREDENSVTRYVENIDTHDGATEFTSNPQLARIFSGDEWVRIWARPGFRLIVPDGLPATA